MTCALPPIPDFLEPWRLVEGLAIHIVNRDGETIAVLHNSQRDVAARIVASVNAFEGLNTNAIEKVRGIVARRGGAL